MKKMYKKYDFLNIDFILYYSFYYIFYYSFFCVKLFINKIYLYIYFKYI